MPNWEQLGTLYRQAADGYHRRLFSKAALEALAWRQPGTLLCYTGCVLVGMLFQYVYVYPSCMCICKYVYVYAQAVCVGASIKHHNHHHQCLYAASRPKLYIYIYIYQDIVTGSTCPLDTLQCPAADGHDRL